MHIHKKITGIPYSGPRCQRGNIIAPSIWTQKIITATRNLPKVKEACILNVTFFLPAKNFATNYPCGNDLDNLLKRFLDALNETIFSEAQGGDSCVISLHAHKIKVKSEKKAGALFEIIPISIQI